MTIRVIISRAEAKARELKRYFTGVACKHGHVCERLVNNNGCMECRAIACKEWHKNNKRVRKSRPYATWPEKEKIYSRNKTRNKQKARVAKVTAIKAAKGCARCGFNHPAALHFHHLRDKAGNVNAMVRRSSGLFAATLAEINKCEVLCANCHAIEHWNEARNKKGVA